MAHWAYFAGQELGTTFDLDKDNDGTIDNLSMVFKIDGVNVTVETGDTATAISNINAVTRAELINLLIEDLGDATMPPAFGPNRIFIASSKLGVGSSISVESEGTLASVIGFDTIAENVPNGSDGDTVTIGTMKYIFVHPDQSTVNLQDNTNRVKVICGATVNETAQNFASAINAQSSLDYTASATNRVVTITAKTAGTIGNTILLSKQDNDGDISLSDSSLKGGQ
ncbi:hypothetical protein ABET51_03740 [Metabacillus fastidiosus]|uniref:hypothetical protein n=1 Tax=Metabacillus fastidiosus TaxID=1458 RepID=UPI003D2A8F4B